MLPINRSENPHSGSLPEATRLIDSEETDPTAQPTNKGKTLDEIFDQKTQKTFQSDESNKKALQLEESLGIFQRLLNFLSWSKASESSEVSKTQVNKADPSPIDFVPTIDVPEDIPPQLFNLKFTKTVEPFSKLTDQQYFESFELLSKMSDKSLHQVIKIVLASQNELEKDGALLNLDDLERFQKIKLLQQKNLKEIKLALSKDETISKYFNTAQTLSLAAGILSTIASFVGYDATYAQIASSVSTAIAIAGKSYFNWRADEDKSKLVDYNHINKKLKGYIDSSDDRLQKSAQADIDKQFARLLKGIIKMCKMIYS